MLFAKINIKKICARALRSLDVLLGKVRAGDPTAFRGARLGVVWPEHAQC